MKRDLRRWQAVLRRWSSVTLGLSVGTSIILLGTAAIGSQALRLSGSLRGWMVAPFGCLAIGALVAMARSGVLGNLGALKAYVNPPRWLQILAVFALVVAAWTRFPATLPESLAAPVGTFCHRWGYRLVQLTLVTNVLLVLLPHLHRRIRRARRTRLKTASIDLIGADFNALRAWLRTDDEIQDFTEDAFQHSRIALRIVERIAAAAQGALGRCPTFALVGELGAGKSSILQLVRASLEERQLLDRRILVVSASLWPFDSPEAAIKGILTSIEAAFSKITSTSSIAHAPEIYLKAIENIDKRLGLLTELLAKERTPADALEAYSRLATLVGVHVVIWIEDMERFERSEAGGDSRAGSIRALLYQLQRFDRLTVVLASDNLTARVDFHKISQFVESIPPLEIGTVWPVISRFRTGCLAMFSPGEVDPAGDARDELSQKTDESLPFLESLLGSQSTLKGAIAYFCNTPRILKFSLRAVLDAWDVLHGEIDFDDLLIMGLLRAARPEIFALVEKYSTALSHGPSKHRRDLQKNDEAFETELRALLDGDAPSKLAIDELLKFVFPRRSKGSAEIKPQGMSVWTPHDYWRRFLSLAALVPSERDQPVLRAILDWNNGATSALVSLISDPERQLVVEQFVRLVTQPRLRALFEELVHVRSRQDTACWPAVDERMDGTRPPGIISVWRMFHRVREADDLDEVALAVSVERALKEAVPQNLRLGHEVFHYFVTADSQVSPLVGGAAAVAVTGLLESLLLGYAGHSAALVAALRGSYRFTLWWICWRLDRIRAKQHLSGVPFAGWKALADTILEAARTDPGVLLPQIPWFFVFFEDSIETRSGRVVQSMKFNKSVADHLFGLVELGQVFACDDTLLGELPSERMEEVKFVRAQLAESLKVLTPESQTPTPESAAR